MVNSYGLPECIDWVERESGWTRAQGQAAERQGQGPGLCLLALHLRRLQAGELDRRAARHREAQARLRRLDRGADRRRRYRPGLVHRAGADAWPRCWASTSARVRIVTGDSDVVPKDNGSYSSRVTFIVGNAAIDAANKLKARAGRGRRAQARRRARRHRMPGRALSRRRAGQGRSPSRRWSTEALKDSGTITVTGTYSTIPESHGGKKYRGAAIGGTMGYSYSAQVVEVTVDEETGEVTVDKVWVAHDCGKALNRLTVEGQVQGSVWMGMGQAMSEEAGYHDGLLVTANMLDYRVPTIQDSPPIEVGIVESNDPHGPFGAKEAGEGSLAAFLPALTNAIADAIGAALQRSAGDARPRVRGDREARSAAAASKRNGRRLMEALPNSSCCARRRSPSVLEARAAHPDSQLLGGGTDLVVNIRRGIVAPPVLIDMNGVAELRAIRADAQRPRDRRRRSRWPSSRAHPGRAASTIRWWRRRPARSPGRRIATWARSAAISASTRAASSTIRANGGARPTTTASRPPATSATWRRRAAACASPPSAAISRRRC